MSEDINIGAISEALNNKVDLNQLNTNTQGLSYASSWGMPSSRYIDLELGASGSDYYAPANGWFCLSKTSSGVEDINMRNYTKNIWTYSSGTNGKWMHCYLPAQKDDQIHIEYTATGTTNKFVFIYAEGEQ